jgi:ribosomal protein S9
MNKMSYEEAALVLGCDHHWVRMLTSKGKFTIVDRVEVKPNVLKVYINGDEVEAYREAHRARHTVKLCLTEDEENAVDRFLSSYRKGH